MPDPDMLIQKYADDPAVGSAAAGTVGLLRAALQGIPAQSVAGWSGIEHGIGSLAGGAGLDAAGNSAADAVRGTQEALAPSVSPEAADLARAVGDSPVGRAANWAGTFYDNRANDTSELVGGYLGPSAGGLTAATLAVVPTIIGGPEGEGAEPVIAAIAKSRRAASNTGKDAVGTLFEDVTDPDQAMDLARSGAHLKQDPSGQYVGAPRGVDSPAKLGAMRRQLDAQVSQGAFNADWYHRAMDAIANISDDGTQASLAARSGAAHSPSATPMHETNNMLLQHNAQVVAGEHVAPGMASAANNVAQAYQYNPETGLIELQPNAIKLGPKTGPYADAKDPTVPESSLYKTANDIWHARAYGYRGTEKDPDALFARGLTAQEHGFLTGENLLAADRANQLGVPVGSLPPGTMHNPRTMQAATWGAVRFNEYKDAAKQQLKAGTIKEMPSDQKLMAQAQGGIDDALNRYVASATHEYAPGLNTGHLGGLDPAALAEHTNAVAGLYGDRDPYYSAMGMFQRPRVQTEGEYVNSAGAVEHNPAFVAQPMVELQNSDLGTSASGKPITGGMQTGPYSRSAMDAIETIRSALNAQEAGAWNKFTPANSSFKAPEKNGVRITGSPDQVEAARAALTGNGVDTVRVGDNALHALSFSGDPAASVQKRIQQSVADLSVLAQPGRVEASYLPINWGPEGSGQVTRQLVGQLERPDIQNLATKLDRGQLPDILGRQNELEQQFATKYGLSMRPDLVSLRGLIHEKGFQGLLKHVRQAGYVGLPAAAGAAVLASDPSTEPSVEQ